MKNLLCLSLVIFFAFFPEDRGQSQNSTNTPKTADNSPISSVTSKPAAAPEESPIVSSEKKRTDSLVNVLLQKSADRDRQYNAVVNILTVTQAENKQLKQEIEELTQNKAIPAISDHTEADYLPITPIVQINKLCDSVACVIVDPTSVLRKKNFFRRIASIFNKKSNGTKRTNRN